MTDLIAQRRFFAEEVQLAANLRTPAVVDALASVPRERFLPPGPWTIRSEADFGGPPRQTPGDDPRFVYHNVAVAIDAERMLFNGVPAVVGMAIDALSPQAGQRLLHIGTGTGYFTALAAHCVGPTGRVVGIEVDPRLAEQARRNLATRPWIDVRGGDATDPFDEAFDAILVNAGVTHPLPVWLDALGPNGRMIVPLTATWPGMGNIGKGLLLLLSRTQDPQQLVVRPITFVAIYSAVGVRDDGLNERLGAGLKRNPFPAIKRLRRDRHAEGPSCWAHSETCCFSLD